MEQCLRLARKLQEDPVGVLRLMGRPDAAALLDDLWPRKSNYLAITQSEREVIKQWRDMTSNDRYHFLALLTISADRERASTHGRRGPRPVRNDGSANPLLGSGAATLEELNLVHEWNELVRLRQDAIADTAAGREQVRKHLAALCLRLRPR